jgi:hydrogenase expression/formation protein HypE
VHRRPLAKGAATVKRDLMLEPLPAGKLPSWLLHKVLPRSPRDPDILVGPGLGRDAAAIAVGGRVVVAKNDPITFASENGAAHLVEVNANDVACMGATPRWLLVTALLPHGVTPADVLNQFAELRETCRHRSVELIGGHTEIVPGLARPILVGMMLGDASPSELLRPGLAQPGDVLLVTKGLAIEGTALLARELGVELRELIGDELVRDAARLMDQPGISVVAEAEIARHAGQVTALHDPTEGGLASAVRELALVSGAGVEIDAEAVPILAETLAVAAALSIDPLGMLASGSLLIATRPEDAPSIVRDIEAAGIPVSVIGRLTYDPEEASIIVDGEKRPLPEFAVDEVARMLSRTGIARSSPAPNS